MTVQEMIKECINETQIKAITEQMKISMRAWLECAVDFGKNIDELTEENEQLQQKYLSESYEKSKLVSQIEQAKKILKDIITWAEWEGPGCPNFDDIKKKVEKLLNE